MKVLIDHRTIRGIPALEFYNPEADGKLPIVILMHAFTGRKEHLFMHAYQLAREGFYAVAIDLPRHGDLGDTPFMPEREIHHFNDIVEEGVTFVKCLVDEYQPNSAADGSRIGLMGFSMGGSVIYRYLPQKQPGVKAAVTMVAGAVPFWRKTFRSMMQVFPSLGVTEVLLAWFENEMPRDNFLEGVKDFPLLMQYGLEDPILPIEEVRTMYQQVQRQYSQPDKLMLAEHEKTGHETPEAMITRSVEWLKRYL